MGRDITLSRAIWADSGIWRSAILVIAGSLFVAVAAQIAVPIGPVPISLQSLAVLLVGFVLGSRLGAAALLAYLAEGALGLPVFANAGGSLAYFAGPTTGFLFGFVAVAWGAGRAVELGLARGVIGMALTGVVLSVVLYAFGLAWPLAVAGTLGLEGQWFGRDIATYYWPYFVQPFLVGDAIKAALAALIVSGAWGLWSRAK